MENGDPKSYIKKMKKVGKDPIYVYLPPEVVEEWKPIAREHKTSISQIMILSSEKKSMYIHLPPEVVVNWKPIAREHKTSISQVMILAP